MRKVFLTIMMLIFLLPLTAIGANTVTRTGNTCNVSAMDGNFVYTDVGAWPSGYTKGVKVVSIQFIPGAANDFVIIREGSIAGGFITKLESTDGEPRIFIPASPTTYKPAIKYSENTLSSGHRIIINFQSKRNP